MTTLPHRPPLPPPALPCSGGGEYSLLVNSGEFYAAIEPAILAARDRALIQVMTFELDAAGGRLWDALARSPAREKILCVDAFSTATVSDSPAYGLRYFTDADFRREVTDTRRLLRSGTRDGVQVFVTNPLGALCHRFPMRNHKKMMIVDDTAFLGGINFSDHNFAWHDLMVRTAAPSVVSALAEDFKLTLSGVNQAATHDFGAARLYLLDGHNSRSDYETLFAEITAARKSIDIISPYLYNPLLARLRRLSPEVKVRIINSTRNNKPYLRRALLRTAADANAGMEVLLYQPGMSHLKAALIDDQRLILGSYNFDFVGYQLQQEVALSTANAALVNDFRRRVLEPTLSRSIPAPPQAAGPFRWSVWLMDAAEKGVQALRRVAR